jgi:2-dehydropantoate 2-reductase
MRQDTLARRPTEVELFAGAHAPLGEKQSVPTPVNDMLYRRIAELEAAY